ncbi:MAG: TonB-dependent receptor [Rikenellaceae bacterium]
MVEALPIRDTININQVVVTATRTPRLLKETPILTRVISAADIAKYGRTKFEDILTSELAGIEFHQAGYGTTISFQGLDARHILILINGERVAGEIYGNIDFTRINPLAIERIEVMKGSSSVLYGSSAMGATVNIITREADSKGSGAVQFKYAPYFQKNKGKEGKKSNIPNLDGAGYFAGKWGGVSSVTDIKLQSSDPYRIVSSEMEKREYVFVEPASTIAVPPNGMIYVPIDSSGISVSGWRMLSVNQRIGVDFSDKLKLNVAGGYYTKKRYDLNKYNQGQSETTVSDTYNGYEGFNIDGDLSYTINSRHSLSFSVHKNVSFQHEYAEESSTPKQNHQLLTPRLLYTFTHRNGRLITGVDYDMERLKYDLSESGYSTQKKFNSLSFYAQEELKVARNMDLTFGVRGLYSDDSPVIFTPKIAFTYLWGETTTLRANWSMGYRNPSLKERYIKYYQPYMGSWIVGNSELEPEKNNYVSFSGEYFSKSRKFTISAMAYINMFRDKIDTYLDEKINSYVYENTEKTRIIGVEVTGRYMVLNNWWIGGHYAYNHNKENAPTNSSQYIFTSPHTANMNTSYRYKIGKSVLELNLAGRYIGAKDYEDRMPTIIKYSGELVPGMIFGKYKAHSDGYLVLDGSLSATFDSRYKVIFGVDNIFNYRPKVASFNSATTPGLNGSVTVSVRF